MSVEWSQDLTASEAGLVADPQTTVLLPGEVGKEVVFGINIVAERSRAEESVDKAAIGKLAQNLERRFSTLRIDRL